MPDLQINLIKGDKIGTETDYRDALPVNMFGVLKPMFNAAGYMLQFSGLTEFATGFSSDRRGVWNERQKQHFRVSGDRFISVDPIGTVTEIGSVPGSAIAAMPYSFNTQGIVTEGRFWLYDATNGFREVTDSDLGAPLDCVWVDNYYFFTDGEYIYHTDIDDEESIDPLKYATAEFMPDDSLGVGKTQDNKVIVFGRYSIEYFTNAAQENFAFQRVSSRAQKIGIVGTHCKVESNGNWFILGGRKGEGVSVHTVGIGSTTKIATREIDKIIGGYTEDDLAQASLDSYAEDGYNFIIINLPNDTLLFNETLASQAGIDQAWSILKTDVTGSLPWRGYFGVFDPRIGKWVFGDRRDANIGILDEDSATTYGDISEWLLYTPFMKIEQASIDKLEIETIPGHTGSDDATVFVSLTYDGLTYSKEWSETYGDSYDYGKRFILRRLGYVRDWVGIKMRGATRSRMAFSSGMISYG